MNCYFVEYQIFKIDMLIETMICGVFLYIGYYNSYIDGYGNAYISKVRECPQDSEKALRMVVLAKYFRKYLRLCWWNTQLSHNSNTDIRRRL